MTTPKEKAIQHLKDVHSFSCGFRTGDIETHIMRALDIALAEQAREIFDELVYVLSIADEQEMMTKFSELQKKWVR